MNPREADMGSSCSHLEAAWPQTEPNSAVNTGLHGGWHAIQADVVLFIYIFLAKDWHIFDHVIIFLAVTE